LRRSGPRRHHPTVLALLLTPAVLASLALAAHFLRRGQLLPCAVCVALVALAFVRRPWSRRVWQGLLGIGSLMWLATLSAIARQRIHDGESWTRTAVILGAVAGFTLVAAALLEHPRVYAHFAGRPDEAAH
jgi:glucose-6-phosphate-specific signal transduction histidine kinase